ncbi:hypothetical protein ACWGPD_04560 [Streptomyces hirsutus]|uniref:hypothetical protein n=1 Tax=Streptomyces hirsutus TaxID=35620 RepID=UPI00362ADFF0
MANRRRHFVEVCPDVPPALSDRRRAGHAGRRPRDREPPARLLAPVDDHVPICPGLTDAWDPDTRTCGAGLSGPGHSTGDPGTGDGGGGGRPFPPVKTARPTALTVAGRRPALHTAGPLHQLVTTAGRDPAGALPELDRLVDARCADYRDLRETHRIPVVRQIDYRTRVVVAVFEPAVRHPGTSSRSGEPGWGSGTVVPMHPE